MNQKQLLDAFGNLSVFQSKGRRAPHKPLLALLAIARQEDGADRLIPFHDLVDQLDALIRTFGPSVSSTKPNYPFWYMQFDGVWEIENPQSLRVNKDGAPGSPELKKRGVGGFTREVFRSLARSKDTRRALAHQLLDDHFPESLHSEILSMVGLSLDKSRSTKIRDSRFRGNVLRAYGDECSICGFQTTFARSSFGLDAAHIKWKAANGPDLVSNGLALCALHHRALDRGIFGIDENYCIQVSSLLSGSKSARTWFLPYHGMGLHMPHASHLEPDQRFLAWHRREVFKAPARGH